MKHDTLHSLITGRTVFESASRLAVSGDRHLCTAGLILLQDALELIFLGLLREIGVDESKNLESKSFDELVGELKKAELSVPRSGTLKALNKQRVICKHYGQLAEPATVHGYLQTAESVLATVVPQVLGKSLQDVFLSDLLQDGEAKELLQSAARNLESESYLDALIDIRKALFLEIESDYAIHRWKDSDQANAGFGLLSVGISGSGLKAPYWTRNREWIEKNVSSPLEYIQIDYEKIRIDAMEWGIHTEELRNIRRLTPQVFREEKNAQWHMQFDLDFPPNLANAENASYCLDRVIDILLKKQQHSLAGRWPKRERPFDPPAIYIDSAVYSKASTDSEVVHIIDPEFRYTIYRVVSGFDPDEKYYYISGYKADSNNFMGGLYKAGYLKVQEDGD